MSPRRSSRARATQPPHLTHSGSAGSAGNNGNGSSSNSVASSLRAERATRSAGKAGSPQKTEETARSDDEIEDDEAGDDVKRESRRNRGSGRRGANPDSYAGADDDGEADIEEVEAEPEVVDEIVEEEETTRCICGQQDYPGPPVVEVATTTSGRTTKGRMGSASGPMMAAIIASTGADAELVGEEAGSLFIQCDSCKVWQHGGCVGIMEEASCPDEYYCEQCKPEYHSLGKSTIGQRYSKYLPVVEPNKPLPKPSRKAPIAQSKETESRMSREREKEKLSMRNSVDHLTKRRSTMNSRAAYDEDEVLRKVLEESKGDLPTSSERRAKRGRDDSDDANKSPIKRMRTTSVSTSHSRTSESLGVGDSDQETPRASKNSKSLKNGRTVPSRNLREKESREKEKERAEAAKRRGSRAERRRNDGLESSPVSTPQPTSYPSSAPPRPDPNATPTRDTESAIPDSPAPSIAGAAGSSHKKTSARAATAVSKRRLGRGRDPTTSADHSPKPDFADPSPRSSADVVPATDTPAVNGVGKPDKSDGATPTGSSAHTVPASGTGRRKGRERHGLTDLRKRAAYMLEYISRVQVDLAQRQAANGDSGSGGASTPLRKVRGADGSPASGAEDAANGGGESSRETTVKAEGGGGNLAETLKTLLEGSGGGDAGLAAFQGLSTMEMMDDLTRKLVLWQREFGKFGEK